MYVQLTNQIKSLIANATFVKLKSQFTKNKYSDDHLHVIFMHAHHYEL